MQATPAPPSIVTATVKRSPLPWKPLIAAAAVLIGLIGVSFMGGEDDDDDFDSDESAEIDSGSPSEARAAPPRDPFARRRIDSVPADAAAAIASLSLFADAAVRSEGAPQLLGQAAAPHGGVLLTLAQPGKDASGEPCTVRVLVQLDASGDVTTTRVGAVIPQRVRKAEALLESLDIDDLEIE